MFQNYYGYPPQQQFLQQQQTHQPTTELIKVSNIESAKAFQMTANSSQALFHENENIFYIKTTDGANFPTIRVFKFDEITQDNKLNQDYISRNELQEILTKFKAELKEGENNE